MMTLHSFIFMMLLITSYRILKYISHSVEVPTVWNYWWQKKNVRKTTDRKVRWEQQINQTIQEHKIQTYSDKVVVR